MTRYLAIGAATLGLLTMGMPSGAGTASGEPRVLEVSMVDKSPTQFAFEPADLTVREGDVIRFVQKGVMPHNVEFRTLPQGVKLADNVRMGRFLTRAGETYDVVIDATFRPGDYGYVCTPHATMGMTGTITVTAEGR